MRSYIYVLVLFILVFFTLVPLKTVTAQEKPARTKVPSYQEQISVQYTLVDVTVTGKEGRYLHGLGKEDFELFENGRRQEILSVDEFSMPEFLFTHVDGQSEPEAAIAEEVNEQAPRTIIVFLDLYFSSPGGIERALTVTEDFVRERMQPGDRMMVLAFFQAIRVIQPFTSDKERVIKSLQEHGLTATGFTTMLSGVGDSSSAVDQWVADMLEKFNAGEKRARQMVVRQYLDGLQEFGNYLQDFRGRKTVILLSEGFSFGLIDKTTSHYEENLPSGSLLSQYKSTLQNLNEAMVRIYALDVGGLKVPGNAANRSLSNRSGTVEGEILKDREVMQNRQDSLVSMAVETGGKAYLNTNDLSGMLDQVEMDVSNYYILGYRSDFDPGESEYRELEVKVTIPDASVRHREGFRTPVAFSAMSREARDTHLTAGFSNGVRLNELDAHFASHSLQMAPRDIRVSVNISVPRAELQLNERDEYEVQVLASVLDADNEMISSVHEHILIPQEKATFETLLLEKTLQARPGINRVRLALRDNTTGKRSYYLYNPIFKEKPETGLAVSTPVFYEALVAPGSADKGFDIRKPEKWNVGEELPALLVHPEDGQVIPDSDGSITAGQPVHLLSRVADLGGAELNPETLTVQLLASRDDGTPLENRPAFTVTPTRLALPRYEDEGQLAVSATVDSSGWEPGPYDFAIIVTDTSNNRKASSLTRLVVNE